ncbi:MAG: hypothetical protein H7Z74_06060 [Anaerolineae bacterium]|nr:hypothetical protein [Gemmatimonadaceae bacterium]
MRVDQVTVNDKLAQVAAPLVISARSSAIAENYVARALIVSLVSSGGSLPLAHNSQRRRRTDAPVRKPYSNA